MLRRDCRLSLLLPDWGEGSESFDFFLRHFKGKKKGMKIHLRKKPGPITRYKVEAVLFKTAQFKTEDKLSKSWIHHRLSL